MKRLNVELFLTLRLDEAHCGASDRFGDSLGVSIVVLLCLHIRAHIFKRHQFHIEAATDELAPEAGNDNNQVLAKAGA